MSLRARPRLLAACLVQAAVPTACTSSPESTPSPIAADASGVNEAMAAVADARRVAAEQVDAELRTALRVEPLVMCLRSPSSIDATLTQAEPGSWGLWQEVLAEAAALDENRWRCRTEVAAADQQAAGVVARRPTEQPSPTP